MVGVVITPVLLYFISCPAVIAWRCMLMSAAIPAIIILITRLETPESPRWLLAKDGKQEAINLIKNYK